MSIGKEYGWFGKLFLSASVLACGAVILSLAFKILSPTPKFAAPLTPASKFVRWGLPQES